MPETNIKFKLKTKILIIKNLTKTYKLTLPKN